MAAAQALAAVVADGAGAAALEAARGALLETGMATVLADAALRGPLQAAAAVVAERRVPAWCATAGDLAGAGAAVAHAVSLAHALTTWPPLERVPGAGATVDVLALAGLRIATAVLASDRHGGAPPELHRAALDLLATVTAALTRETVAAMAADMRVGADGRRDRYVVALLDTVEACPNDVAVLNVAWKHAVRLLTEATVLPAPTLARIAACVVAGVDAHLPAYVVTAATTDAKETRRQLTLLRFFLAHWSQLVRAHGASVARHGATRTVLANGLVRLRALLPPAMSSAANSTSTTSAVAAGAIEVLEGQVAFALDSILCQWLGHAALSADDRTAVVAALIQPDQPALGVLQLCTVLLRYAGTGDGSATDVTLPLRPGDLWTLLDDGILASLGRLAPGLLLAPTSGRAGEPPHGLLSQVITVATATALCLLPPRALQWETSLITTLTRASSTDGARGSGSGGGGGALALAAVAATVELLGQWYAALAESAAGASTNDGHVADAVVLLLEVWSGSAAALLASSPRVAAADGRWLACQALLDVAAGAARHVSRARLPSLAEQITARAAAGYQLESATGAGPGGLGTPVPLTTVRALGAMCVLAPLVARLPPGTQSALQQLVDGAVVRLLAQLSVVAPRAGSSASPASSPMMTTPAALVSATASAAFVGRHLAHTLRGSAAASVPLLLPATLPRLPSLVGCVSHALTLLAGPPDRLPVLAGLAPAQLWSALAPTLAFLAYLVPALSVHDLAPLLTSAASAATTAAVAVLVAGWLGGCGQARPRAGPDATAFGAALRSLAHAVLAVEATTHAGALAQAEALHQLVQFARYTNLPNVVETLIPPAQQTLVVAYAGGGGDEIPRPGEVALWALLPAAVPWLPATLSPPAPAAVELENVDPAPPLAKRARTTVVDNVRAAVQAVLRDDTAAWREALSAAERQALLDELDRLRGLLLA
jgi:hypothetical protein